MSVQIACYCIKSVTDVAKLAIEYRKVMEIQRLNSELERQNLISESIMSYCSLIRTDVQSLMNLYFKSAYENLNYALTASGENRNEYLRQAKNRFIDAITIEKNENLILSYLGLELCQGLINDQANSIKTLSRIKNVCCTLPDDYEALSSMMVYDEEWYSFFLAIVWFKNFDRAFEKRFFYMPPGKYKAVVKEYYKRRLRALISCGGFSWDEKEWLDNNKRAMKKILQEDFDSFKSEILLQFGIE